MGSPANYLQVFPRVKQEGASEVSPDGESGS